jgi:hypothetical protein
MQAAGSTQFLDSVFLEKPFCRGKGGLSMREPCSTRSIGAACVAVAVLTASANVSAASPHYYALLDTDITNGDADDGAFIEIWTNILHSTCNPPFTYNFVNHEMWYETISTGVDWVEVGFKDGADNSGGCQTNDLFWADQRPNGSYNEHYPGVTLSFGQWMAFEVVTLGPGSCSWSVFLNGFLIGTSTSNCPGSGRLLAAGIESTSQTTGSVKGWLGDWWEDSASNTWTNAWDSAGLCQTEGNPAVFVPCPHNSGNPQIEFATGIGTEEVLNEGF